MATALKEKSPREKFAHNLEVTCNRYFLDVNSKITLPHQVIKGSNMLLMYLGYAMKKNLLLMGEPGFAKTTASAIVGSTSTGLPMDLFRSVLISGHPEQSEEKTIGRPDFGKLMAEIEAVIWQKALYFPLLQLDEFNRLPEGKQSEILDAIATGRFSYLNDNFYRGLKSFFATVNYQDGGNHEILPAGLDRFNMSLELGFQGALYSDVIEKLSIQAEQELSNPELTSKILEMLQNKKLSVSEKLEAIEALKKKSAPQFQEKTGLEVITEDEFGAIRRSIMDIGIEQEATIYLHAINSEFNSTALYGAKRSCDPIDTSNHSKALASSNVGNAFSPRAYLSIKHFAKALAWYTGAETVTKAHIDAVAPYCMRHRLRFTEDFKSQHTLDERTETFETCLSRSLLTGVTNNFKHLKELYMAFEKYFECIRLGKKPESEKQLKGYLPRINELIETPGNADHPLLKEYAVMAKDYRPQP